MSGLAPAPVHPPAPVFGDAATVVVSTGFGGGGSISPTQDLANARNFGVSLAGEVFVVRRLSFGSSIGLSYEHDRLGVTTYVYGITQRVGWAIPLGGIVTFWPRLGLASLHESRDGGTRGRENGTLALSIFAPIEISPFSHVVIGLGPSVMTDMVRRADGVSRPIRTSLSLNGEVAAWF
jgi:hypothetical protein